MSTCEVFKSFIDDTLNLSETARATADRLLREAYNQELTEITAKIKK